VGHLYEIKFNNHHIAAAVGTVNWLFSGLNITYFMIILKIGVDIS